MRLVDLPFSDMFVGPDRGWTWYRVTSNSRDCIDIPDELVGEVDAFRAHLHSLADGPDGRTVWDGLPLRVKRKAVDDDVILYVIRRYTLDEYSLDKIGIQDSVVRALHGDHELLKNGAVAVLGPPGGGKSSTALSFVLDRIRKYGGTAWRIGCPVENPMQGRHGKGWLYEISVKRDEEIGDQIRELYRTVPNIVLVEEVRDAHTAMEVVRAAGSGWLQVFTFHGNDLPGGLSQFVRLAGGDDLEQTAARIADFLRLAVYVELHAVPVGMHVKKLSFVASEEGKENVLSAQPLFFTEKDSGLRSMVRNSEYHKLDNEIQRQRRVLMAGGSLIE